MPNLGLPELIVILIILLAVFGAGKLPEVGSALGKAMREFRQGQTGSHEKIPPTETGGPVEEESSSPN